MLHDLVIESRLKLLPNGEDTLQLRHIFVGIFKFLLQGSPCCIEMRTKLGIVQITKNANGLFAPISTITKIYVRKISQELTLCIMPMIFLAGSLLVSRVTPAAILLSALLKTCIEMGSFPVQMFILILFMSAMRYDIPVR